MALGAFYQNYHQLTICQRLFCDYYLSNDYDRIDAIKRAYGGNKSDKVCSVMAAENLRKPSIKKYIEDRMKEAIDKVGVGIEYRLNVVKDVIGACMDGSASKDCVVYADGALKGVAELNKMTGDYAPTKTETKDTSDPCEGMDTLIAQSKNEY
jgi:phage terminase small subunit